MPRKIISCPACNARFDVGRFAAGSRVKCGRCEQILTVPDTVVPSARPGAPSYPPKARRPSAQMPSHSSPVAPRKRPSSPSRRPAAPRPANDIPAPKPSPLSAPNQAPVTTSVGGSGVPDRDPLLGAVINSVFRVVRKLGEGGYGAVYEAKDVNLERRVAIKVMLPSRAKNREYVTKFLREARTAAQLVHPNVVAVHSVGYDQENAVHYLAMEYVEGRTIHDILQERGPLPVDEAIDFIVQSCRGLQAAHDRNIIHRDIKPGNLMLTPRGVIKIADFGLAKIYDAEAAKSTVIGTPYFMPPEQFEGKAKDGRTDIYALGVTFYYMLTMQRPHSGSGPAQILLSVMTKEPKSVLEHRPDLPEGIWPIVARMIHRDPESRYSICNDIIRDLEALRGGSEPEDDSEHIYCPQCGAANALDASACGSCETSLLEKCPKCGAEDMAGTKFCGDCGANIPLERAVAALLDEAEEFLAHGRVERARERLTQANDRSPENDRLARLLERLDEKLHTHREHCDQIRGLLGKGQPADARRRLAQAQAEFPESAELGTIELEIADVGGMGTQGIETSEASDPLSAAQRLEMEGRYREALVAWRGILVLDAKHAVAREGEERVASRVERAEALTAAAAEKLQQGNPQEALGELEEAATLLPNDPVIEGRLHSSRRLAEELRTELELIERELESGGSPTLQPRLRALNARFPGSRPVAEAVRRVESQLAAREQASLEASRERVKQLVVVAREHEQARRLREALAAYRDAAAIDRDDQEIAEGLTRARRQIAEFDAVVNQARDLLESGDPEEADARIEEALRILPGDPAAQTQKARIRSALETMRYEAERIRTALTHEPDEDVLSWAQELANRFPGSRLATDVLKEAGAAFHDAAQRAALQQVDKHVARAEKLEREGNVAAALSAFRKALERLPDHAEARSGAERLERRLSDAASNASEAAAALERGDPERAVTLAEESLALHPNQPGPAGTLAEARTSKGEIDRAEKTFQEQVPLELAARQLDRLRALADKFGGSDVCTQLVERAEAVVARSRSAERDELRRQRLEQARGTLADGGLTAAIALAEELLAEDGADAEARAIVDEVRSRQATANEALEQGRAAAAEGRHADAVHAFGAALEADPGLAAAEQARAESSLALEQAAQRLRGAVEEARAATRGDDARTALAAWDAVCAQDATHEEAARESGRLRARIEKGERCVEQGRERLEQGDPEHALAPLREAQTALGASDELTELIARAESGRDEIQRVAREVGNALAQEGALDDALTTAGSLAERFPGSDTAGRLVDRAEQAVSDRRRQLAGSEVRGMIDAGRFKEALDHITLLRQQGVNSPELAANEKEAEKALREVQRHRAAADAARSAGDLGAALAALRTLAGSVPGDATTLAEIQEVEGLIEELESRRAAAARAERRGDLSEAKTLLAQAHTLNPGAGHLTSELTRLDEELRQRRTQLEMCTSALSRGDGAACTASASVVLSRYPDDEDARDLVAAGQGLEAVVEALRRRAERMMTVRDRDGALATLEILQRVAPADDRARAFRAALEGDTQTGTVAASDED